jgi:DNA-binding PadR family transcriptional regulator
MRQRRTLAGVSFTDGLDRDEVAPSRAWQAQLTPQPFGRSSDRGMLILTSLAAGDKHGYALMQDIEEFSGAKLGPGTLYGALARLEEAGLVEALPAQDRRRPYRITPAGSVALHRELSDTTRIAQLGLRRLATGGS